MSECKELEKILRESFVSYSPRGRSVRSFRVLNDIMPGDRERIADELARLLKMEAHLATCRELIKQFVQFEYDLPLSLIVEGEQALAALGEDK